MKLVETILDSESIPDILIRRVPFLKEYDIQIKTDDKISAHRIVSHKDVSVMMGDEILQIKTVNVISEFYYSKEEINDHVFYYFNISNKIHMSRPENLDDLTYRVFLAANKMVSEKLSYRKEYRDKLDLTNVINELNANLFHMEEFTEDNYIRLF